MQLLIGDNFQIFQKFKISTEDISSTFHAPLSVQNLLVDVQLSIRKFNNIDRERTYLLLGTQRQKDKRIFSFAYWIPEQFYNDQVELISILEIFLNSFGFKFRIGDQEGYFIRYSKKLLTGKVQNPQNIIDSTVPDQVPKDCHFFLNENSIGSLNHLNVHYAFCLNSGKYLFWLNAFPFVKLKVRSGWQEFVQTNLLDYVQPEGNTVIKIHKQQENNYLGSDTSNKFSEISVPLAYEKKFEYILKQINNSKNNEKIGFSLSFNSPKCLFCRSEDLSKEHIFPKWIRPYLPEKVFKGSSFFDYGNEDFKDLLNSSTSLGKKESSHGFTTNLVCINCNNTWLSELEIKAKRILVKNGALRSSIENLGNEDARILSRWLIIKSLLLSNKMHSNTHQFPQQLFENLKNDKIESGFLVEYVKSENENFDFTVSKGILRSDNIKVKNLDAKKAEEMLNNFFVGCIQFNNLLFRISYLNPKLPFIRETKFKKTTSFVAFPNLRHS